MIFKELPFCSVELDVKFLGMSLESIPTFTKQIHRPPLRTRVKRSHHGAYDRRYR